MSGAASLPYHGDDPAALLVVAAQIQQARGRLAALNDGLVDARGDLTRSWNGGAAEVGDAEVGRAIAATAQGVGRLDVARSAVLNCSDELTEIRLTINALRVEWDFNERQISLLNGLVTGPAGASADVVEQQRMAELARYQGNQAALLEDWRHQAGLADTATLACAEKLTGSIQGEEFAAAAGTAHGSLAAALGTELLGLDDSLLSRLASGDSSSWNRFSAADQAFLLAIARDSGFPPAEISPQSVNAAWISLDPLAQQALIHAQPASVGVLDGIPAVARDQANRMLLPALSAQLEAELRALGPRPRDAGTPTYLDPTPGVQYAWDRQHTVLSGELAGLSFLGVGLATADPTPVYLMGLDLQDRGKAIVSIGNPDIAANVATSIPGTGAGLASISGDIARSASLYQSAQAAGSRSTAVITWLGYSPPPSLPDAAYDSYADNGGPALNGFADGLRATHLGEPSHNTVLVHSYAALVVAAAASGGNQLAMDDVVVAGGTGMELPNAESVHLVSVPPDQMRNHLFATLAENDPIGFSSPVHADLPSDPGFGATVFDAGVPDGMLSAHSAYWDPQTNALTTMGQIIAGVRIDGPR